jgi:predicted ribosomally synthesized peptide with SipW-like signal peptide
MKKKMLLILLAVAVSVSMIAAATMAWFTADDDAGEATFTAGILSVDVSKGVEQFLECDTIDHMNPGDEFGPITIEIVNDGTKKLAWFGDWQFTLVEGTGEEGHIDGDKLLDVLYIKEARMEMFKPNPDFNESEDESEANPKYVHWTNTDEHNDNFIKDGIGHGPNPVWYNTLAAKSDYGVITLRNWNDNTGMTSAPYEHMGALKPGNKYVLTVKLGFVGTNEDQNEYQGNQPGVSPIKVGFKVDAFQVNQDALNAIGRGSHFNFFNDQISAQ